jgi:ABC-type branched-subunit amino acid transport system substrate-binding protein
MRHFNNFILFVFFVTGCTPAKKVVVAPDAGLKKIEEFVPEPKKTSDVKVDTIILVNKTSSIIPPPITEGNETTKRSHVRRKIGMILPFKTSLGRVSERENLSFLQYYGGVKIAAKQLEEEGINLDIEVFDAEKVTMSNLNTQWDMIIGPYATAANDANKLLFQNVVDFGKKNKVLVVSPFYSNSKTTENNPYYLQLKPNLRVYLSRIVEHISKNFTNDEVALVLRDSNVDSRWNEYIQMQAAGYFNKTETNVIDKIIVKETALQDKTPFFAEHMAKGKKVFILPNYSFNDELYLQQVLAKINNEKTTKDIIVYGMPVILESDKISVSLYNAIQIRLVVPDFIEKNNEKANEFTNRFFNEYKTIPSGMAFDGYDMMLFLGRAVSEKGKDFPKTTGKVNVPYLQTSFNIQAVYEDGDDSFTKLLFYENKHLDVIAFSGGRFRKI